MFQLVSGALGIAIATAVFTARAGSAVGGTAFVAGFHGALRSVAGIAVLGMTTVWIVVRRPAAT